MGIKNKYSLTKGEVMMYLDLAKLNRKAAAEMAGIGQRTFLRLMRAYGVKAPKSHAKLSRKRVVMIRSLLKKHPRRLIAQALELHVNTIDQVANYETWYQIA